MQSSDHCMITNQTNFCCVDLKKIVQYFAGKNYVFFKYEQVVFVAHELSI